MTRDKIIRAAVVGLLLGAVARGDDAPRLNREAARREVARVGAAAEVELARGCNAFAFDLYRQRVSEKGRGTGNLLVAPYCLAETLGLVYTGARGKTADEIARTLHLAPKPGQAGPAFAGLGIGAGGSLTDPRPAARYRFGARVQDARGGTVEIVEVKAGSPASEASLKPGDRVLRLGDWTIRTVADYAVALDSFIGSVEGEVQAGEERRAFRARLNAPATEAATVIRPLLINAVWASQGLEFTPAFEDTASFYFNATVGAVDFATNPTSARDQLNREMTERTDDRISDLLPADAFPPGTALVLANATGLNLSWRGRFDPKKTREDNFTTSDGPVRVPMMEKRSTFRYGKTTAFQVVDLLLEGDYAMAIFLPTERDGLEDFESRLFTADNHSFFLEQLKPHVVNATLPRFELSAGDVQGALTALGLTTLFTGSADLSGLIQKPLGGAPRLVHKATLSVNERGFDDAAGTGSSYEPLIPAVTTFKADHPFLFTIRHTRSKTVLFIGRVASPRGR